ncbi:MAG: hypothetical protein K0Q99_570 [Clostridia bacterium]|jgi:hypothetical protein|nr:hypothetical protein [Clostridia bacterium]
MWILLVIVLLIPVVYFGYLMSKLDQFLAGNALRIDGSKTSYSAIVLGKTDLAKQVTTLLESKGVRVLALNEPFLFEKDKDLRYMFALSDKDADNIVLCKIGKKVYSIETMIGICNDRRNENMFISEGILYKLDEGITAQMLCQAVLQGVEISS